MSVLEAMAMQLPVVATRTGALESLVGDPQAGVLVETGDAAAMAEAVEHLRAAPGHRRLMGVRGRNAVVERYGLDRMLDAYQRVFEGLCGAAGTNGRLCAVPAGG